MDFRLREYLRQVQIAARESVPFVDGMSYTEFQGDIKTQRAVTMNLVILPEAAAKIEERSPTSRCRIRRLPERPFLGRVKNRSTPASVKAHNDHASRANPTKLPLLHDEHGAHPGGRARR
jgi:uncharacterized protein with HEPN domain